MDKTEQQEYREQFISIDPADLQNEWLQFPSLYDRASQAVADEEQQLDAVKLLADQMKAEMGLNLKQDFKDYGFDKTPTAGDMDNYIQNDTNYKNVRKEILMFNQSVQEAKNFLRALDMKKKALEQLVTLYIANYFSVPIAEKPMKDGKRFTDFVYERHEDKQRERLNMSKEKREEQKKECLDDISDPGVKEVAEKAFEKEEKKDAEVKSKRTRRPLRKRK